MQWLYQALKWCDWKFSPVEIIETELKYPGLIHRLSMLMWQEKLVTEQVEAETDDDDGESS